MSDRLSKLEARIEQLVEGTFSRLFAGRLQPREVAVRLARAMEDNAAPNLKGTRLAPTGYRVLLNPADAEALQQSSPELPSVLANELVLFARDLNVTLAATPLVTIEGNEQIEPHDIAIEPVRGDAGSDTLQLKPVSPAETIRAPKAFLIVDAEKHVPLDLPVMTIGRRLDNTIILDNPRVSRHHAQVRQRHGRWVVYDLGSAGGTMVNNHKVDECVLRPGDVISLAGVSLIYGEEELGDELDDTGHTRPLPPRTDDPPQKVRDDLL